MAEIMTGFSQGCQRWLSKFCRGKTSRRSLAEGGEVAVLFLSHVVDNDTLAEYKKISVAVDGIAEPHFLLHVKADAPPDARLPGDALTFTDEILRTLRYTPLTQAIVPGSAHFPLLHFFLTHSEFDYYWIIEFDVRFAGDWKIFFESTRLIEADLLSSCMNSYTSGSEWFWWPHLNHPKKSVPLAQRLRSFNPIYRISHAALRHLHQCQRDGWVGHFEVLMPTLLLRAGFKLVDLGGAGKFVAAGGQNKFYTEGEDGTMRHRPCHEKTGAEADKLYHPVKAPPPES